jgi:glycosyltransferase involved in cell wall biosynthesis
MAGNFGCHWLCQFIRTTASLTVHWPSQWHLSSAKLKNKGMCQVMEDRPLTVVQLLPALDSGGVERGTLEVAAELVRRGHRSIVISAGGRLVERLETEGSEHIAWTIGGKSPWTFRYVSQLRRLIAEDKVDILHARSRVPAWVAWMAWKSLPNRVKPRFVTTVHGLYRVGKYSSIMASGDAVIAVSGAVRDYVIKNFPHTDPARLRVIPRGRDASEFPHGHHPDDAWLEAWYRDYPQTQGKILLTLPGRLTRLKGHEDFINLIAEIRATGVDAHGLIVGEVDPRRQAYSDELRSLVEHDGLNEHITFTGHRRDIREVFSLSAVVFSLSIQPESFGRTTLEALSIGIPVVGYNHGGVGEILRDVFPQGATTLGNRIELRDRVISLLQEGPFVVPPHDGYRLDQMLEAEIELYRELAA